MPLAIHNRLQRNLALQEIHCNLSEMRATADRIIKLLEGSSSFSPSGNATPIFRESKVRNLSRLTSDFSSASEEQDISATLPRLKNLRWGNKEVQSPDSKKVRKRPISPLPPEDLQVLFRPRRRDASSNSFFRD